VGRRDRHGLRPRGSAAPHPAARAPRPPRATRDYANTLTFGQQFMFRLIERAFPITPWGWPSGPGHSPPRVVADRARWPRPMRHWLAT
jgi:hypothetical protein